MPNIFLICAINIAIANFFLYMPAGAIIASGNSERTILGAILGLILGPIGVILACKLQPRNLDETDPSWIDSGNLNSQDEGGILPPTIAELNA